MKAPSRIHGSTIVIGLGFREFRRLGFRGLGPLDAGEMNFLAMPRQPARGARGRGRGRGRGREPAAKRQKLLPLPGPQGWLCRASECEHEK